MRPDYARQGAVECRKSSEAGSPEATWRRDKNYFGGIGPSSPQWSRIDAIWQRYLEATCDGVTQSMLVDLYRDTYRQMLSEGELAAVTAFMETPAGKKFVRAEQAASARITRDVGSKLRIDYERAVVDYERAYTELSKELGEKK